MSEIGSPRPLVAFDGVSTVAEAPARPPTDEMLSSAPRRVWPSAIATLALAAALVAVPFTTHGGVDEIVASAGNTWTEIALILLGTAGVAVGLLRAPARRRRIGLSVVGLMALLFAVQAASIAWSVQPDSSWLASGQMLAYLMVLAGGVALAQAVPHRWTILLGSLTLFAAAIAAWSLAVKVFPATLAPDNQIGRLQAPFGYWNAVALSAAMGVPCCLWAGARRDGGRRVATLAAPALALLVAVLVLSYSRSADLAAIVAGGLWLTVVPLRLRAVAVGAVGVAGGAAISGWALTHGALMHDNVPIAAQDHAGHIFGIVVLVTLVLTFVVGVGVTEAMDRTTVPTRTRSQIGAALVGVLGVLVVLGILAVASSSRGLTGEISHGWQQLTNPRAVVSASQASRVFDFGSSRPEYWQEALTVGDHNVLHGVGGLGFAVARLRWSADPMPVQQAHSFVFETYADYGVIGLAVTTALLLAWLMTTGRTLGLGRRATGAERVMRPGAEAERIGMVTLAVLVVGFGVQSTLDWTWYFAGVAVPALLAAGWVAGRGPLTADPATAPVAAAQPRSLLDRPGTLGLITLLVAGVLLGSWMIWRPLRSAQLVDSVENTGSLSDAQAARSADPLSLAPLQLLADLDTARHRIAAARRETVAETTVQPDNPDSWEALGEFDLRRHPAKAIAELQRGLALDATGVQHGFLLGLEAIAQNALTAKTSPPPG